MKIAQLYFKLKAIRLELAHFDYYILLQWFNSPIVE